MNKGDLVNELAGRLDSRKEAAAVLETFLETIKQALESGEDVLISGFGEFHVKDKHGREGRNPATGEKIILDPRRIITFRCSSVLKEKINGR